VCLKLFDVVLLPLLGRFWWLEATLYSRSQMQGLCWVQMHGSTRLWSRSMKKSSLKVGHGYVVSSSSHLFVFGK